MQDSMLLAGPSGDGIDSGSGNDSKTIINSRIEAVQAGRNDDTVTMGTGAEIDGLIDCGIGNDSLVFGMTVFPEQIAEISAEIADSEPLGRTVVISGIIYEWQNCEALVNDLVLGIPAVRIRPIPTLSQWGIIEMAVVIGIAGVLFVVRRRTATDA